MRKIKINPFWKPTFLGPQDKAGKFGIYSPALTEKILQYERIRADREESCFSGVLFKLSGSDAANVRFVEVLKKNTRLIDHLGWYDESTVCVVLTATDIDGAQLFADKIRAVVDRNYNNGRRPVYTFELFRYPDKEPDKKDEENRPIIYGQNRLHIDEILKHRFAIEIPLWKRALDVFGSLAGIIILSPLFLAVAVYIKLVSRGPVLYKQTRVGFNGKNFTFLKFRTMRNNNDEHFHSEHALNFVSRSDVPMEKLDSRDPRIIPGGRILRKACIDEFPQLINVLKGEMSLVGPRPCIPYEAERYLRWHAQRFDTMPGITGLWQVSGKNKLSFHEMVSLDIAYSRKISFWVDIELLLLTFPAIAGMVWESVAMRLGKAQSIFS